MPGGKGFVDADGERPNFLEKQSVVLPHTRAIESSAVGLPSHKWHLHDTEFSVVSKTGGPAPLPRQSAAAFHATREPMTESLEQFQARIARRPAPLPLWLSAAIFVGLFFVLQLAYDVGRGSDFEHWVIHDVTVVPTAKAIDLLTPSIGVKALGNQLRAPGGGIVVKKGCEGVEVMFMLIAAFAVVPMAWPRRLAGLGIGLLLVYCLNQARLVGLFYAYRSDSTLFDLLHGTVVPVILVVVVAVFVLYWFQSAHAAEPGASDSDS